ncbi:helix-turn-helix transcriptional regulator [Microvirga rosea]|uniref:helix-turn-helix transcriptional regulator n=1 Tax=Microvirga rosea TaxID=2715425 RepID=UPI001D0A7579|nr:metalloregulator ArsR/SmtB family transcription factor [Microvirga rosea]MCB8822225.1 transcriptional regulator [Microvirga rosea]
MNDRPSDRLLHVLKAHGPQSAAALAQRLGTTVVAVRQQLDRLSERHLVSYEDERTGVGRPKRRWLLTDRGHGRFPDNHAGLTAEILRGVVDLFGPKGLDRLIAHRERETLDSYGKRIGERRDLAERIAELAAIRNEEGYMAAWTQEPDGSFLLIENHCPICVAAATCQGFCRSELSVFGTVLGPDASVHRVEHVLEGARRCAYRIIPAERPAGRSAPLPGANAP